VSCLDDLDDVLSSSYSCHFPALYKHAGLGFSSAGLKRNARLILFAHVSRILCTAAFHPTTEDSLVHLMRHGCRLVVLESGFGLESGLKSFFAGLGLGLGLWL